MRRDSGKRVKNVLFRDAEAPGNTTREPITTESPVRRARRPEKRRWGGHKPTYSVLRRLWSIGLPISVLFVRQLDRQIHHIGESRGTQEPQAKDRQVGVGKCDSKKRIEQANWSSR